MQRHTSRARAGSLSVLVAVAGLAAAGCGNREQRPPEQRERAPASAGAVPTPSVRLATSEPASAATSSEAHALYKTASLSCASCHPCGGSAVHPLAWMDASSSGFHAISADAGLAGCQGCHGVNLDGTGGSAPISCAACHGASWRTNCVMCHGGTENQTGAPPKATWGNGADAVRIGTHSSHLSATHGLSRPVACAECHLVPADALAPGHANGTVELTWGGLATKGGALPSWDGASATCSSTYCHGEFTGGNSSNAPSWTVGDGSQVFCGSCHGLPPGGGHTPNVLCENCHDGYTATSVNPATHIDGVVQTRAMRCNSCHGSAANNAPPRGTHNETETNTRAVGAHQRHLSGGEVGKPVACAECHVVPTAMDHTNNVVEVSFGQLARRNGATPSYDRASMTCTSVYCHGATLTAGGANTTPLWTGGSAEAYCGSCHAVPPPGPQHLSNQECNTCHPGYTRTSVNIATHMNGVVDAVNLSCTTCHGDSRRFAVPGSDPVLVTAAPPYGTHGETSNTTRAVGAHQKHAQSGSTLSAPINCPTCHVVPAVQKHANGHVDLLFSDLATLGGANPTWDGTRCSGTYCHGATLGAGGTNHAPSWTGGAAEGACGSCHGIVPPAPHPQTGKCIDCHPGYTTTTVRKATHVNGSADTQIGCVACHDIPPDSGQHSRHVDRGIDCSRCHAGYTVDEANPQLHRNGRVDVTLRGWDAARLRCSSIGCHDSKDWGSPATSLQPQRCDRCHGVSPDTGRHDRHTGIDCDRCHGDGYGGGSSGSSGGWSGGWSSGWGGHSGDSTGATVNLATHMNGTVEIVISGYNRATMSCNPSCHGNESWRSRGTVESMCTYCHAFPPEAPHPVSTACATCHPMMNADGTMPATHNDGTVQLTGAGCGACHGFPPATTSSGAPHPANASCSLCHPSTVDANNQLVPGGTHQDGVVEFDTSSMTCASCHGDATRVPVVGADPDVQAAPPVGTSGETATTARAVGAHQAHLNKGPGALAAPTRCAECHVVPTAVFHWDGAVNVTFGSLARTNGAAPAWNGTTCSSTYCHGATLGAGGTNHAPSWTGGAAEGACGTCHGIAPPPPHTSSTSCGICHAGYTATSVNPATHVDGIVQVSGHAAGYSAKTLHGYDANRSGLGVCESCHGPTLQGGTTAPSCFTCHASAGFPAWDTSCTFCHGSRTTGRQSPPVDIQGRSVATNVSVGVHDSHVGTTIANPIACTQCHPARTASVVTDTAHVDGDGRAEIVFGPLAKTGGVAPVYTRVSDTSATCASTYCHGNFTGAKNATMSWTSTTQVGCSSCHGVPPSTGKHSYHSSRSCGDCHPGYTSSSVNRTTHLDGAKQVGNKIRTWNPTTRSCSNSCHSSRTW